MNLDSFLKMTGAPDAKGIFPHGFYSSVKELKEAKEFPPMEAFYSELKSGMMCDLKSYREAKSLFEERQNLPEDHPDKMKTMLCWLRFYNNLDVVPLISAIKTWFDIYEEVFDIDGFQYASLASMASGAMFKQFDSDAPLLHSLPPWKKNLSDKMKESVVGGLCTTLHRAVLLDGSDGPESSKRAPNGDEFSAIVPFDFNSLYPWALLQDMPTGPGIHWCANGRDGQQKDYFTKKTLLPGSSCQELRFLMFLSHHDERFKDSNGVPYLMSHAYFRGQEKIAGYAVDGFVKTPLKSYIIEYNGCEWHQPCPFPSCEFHGDYKENDLNQYEWFKKETALQKWASENNAEVIIKWSCQWNEKAVRYLKTFTRPRILRPFESRDASHITELILTDQLFGFAEVSLKSPDSLIKKYEKLNFPPIIRRGTISQDMISDYMKGRLSELDRDIPKKGKTTVINSWNAERIMLFTPMLKWLLGVEMTDVFDIVQYSKNTCFSRFITNCVQGRIDADKANQPTKAQTFKIAMNSSYGKLAENVLKYSDTKISRFSGIRNQWLMPRTVISKLADEDVFEIVKQPKQQKDDKLVPVGAAVLQLSKLLLLKFVYFLEDHLVEGSFKICYLGEFFFVYKNFKQ